MDCFRLIPNYSGRHPEMRWDPLAGAASGKELSECSPSRPAWMRAHRAVHRAWLSRVSPVPTPAAQSRVAGPTRAPGSCSAVTTEGTSGPR